MLGNPQQMPRQHRRSTAIEGAPVEFHSRAAETVHGDDILAKRELDGIAFAEACLSIFGLFKFARAPRTKSYMNAA